MIKVENLSLKLNSIPLLYDISFELNKGDFLAIVGPNGAGKTTLIKSIMGLYNYTGSVYLNNKNIKEFKTVDIAKSVAVLPQFQNSFLNFTVREIVQLGRYAHNKGFFSNQCLNDKNIINEAMNFVGVYEYRNRRISTLSGGELQRVYLAQLFAQNANILILDEAVKNLDIKYISKTYDILNNWLAMGNRAIISVMHDISFAKLYGNKALLLNKGKVVEFASVDKALSKANILNTYDIDMDKYIKQIYEVWQ